MDRARAEGGEADGDVLGALRRLVLDPFAGRGDHGLAGGDVEDAGVVVDAELAVEDDCDLFELGALAGLDPVPAATSFARR